MFEESDISPGWQLRLRNLRITVRDCKCDGEMLRNLDDGREFCKACGRHVEEDSAEHEAAGAGDSLPLE